MKTLSIYILLIIGFANGLFAQNDLDAMDDISRVALRPMLMYSPELSESNRNVLRNKVAQIALYNGLGATGYESRFILTAKVVVISKSIIESAPPMFAYTLEISFYIVDNIEQLIFAQYTFAKKGVGDSEVKALSSVIYQINPKDSRLGIFITKGKEAILEYYNTNCDLIIEKATALIESNEIEKGFEMLLAMPPVNRECYDRAMELVREISNKNPEYAERINPYLSDSKTKTVADEVNDDDGSLDWIGN
jgi:arsenate reductase-like glutaredoxin family protein